MQCIPYQCDVFIVEISQSSSKHRQNTNTFIGGHTVNPQSDFIIKAIDVYANKYNPNEY